MLRIETLFEDPTPNGIVSQRFLNHLISLCEYTNLDEVEREQIRHMLILVAKKLVATWLHFKKYSDIEDRLIDEAKRSRIEETPSVERVCYSQDLFFEFDGFFVQLKSTLDYVVKLPIPILGKNVWSLRTFANNGDGVIKALEKSVPKKYGEKAQMMGEIIQRHQVAWLKDAKAIRDQINHFLDDGQGYKSFLVMKQIKNGKEEIIVPLMAEGEPIRVSLDALWNYLLMLTEDFAVGCLAFKMKEEYIFLHNPPQPNLNVSPWVILPSDAAKPLQQVFGSKLKLS